MFLRLRYRLARLIWPEGHRGLNAVNYPDLPNVADRWTVLDSGHWGTLGATSVGFGRVFVGAFKGYGQVSGGIVLTLSNVLALRKLFEPDPPGAL